MGVDRSTEERRRQEGFIRMVQVQDSRMVRLRAQAVEEASLPAAPAQEVLP